MVPDVGPEHDLETFRRWYAEDKRLPKWAMEKLFALASAREAAFREGAEAMRECIVYRIWGHEWRDPDDLVRQIRALPLPEVK